MKDKLLFTLVGGGAGFAIHAIVYFCYASSYSRPQPFLWPALASVVVFALIAFGLSFMKTRSIPNTPEMTTRVQDVLELEIPTSIKNLGVGIGLLVFAILISLYLVDSSDQNAGFFLFSSILAVCFTAFVVSSYFFDFVKDHFLDSEGFNLGGGKIPWTDVQDITTRKIETRKSTRHYINVVLKEDSPFRQKKSIMNKAGDLIKGQGDFRFQVQIFHGIGIDELATEMKNRWAKATRKEEASN